MLNLNNVRTSFHLAELGDIAGSDYYFGTLPGGFKFEATRKIIDWQIIVTVNVDGTEVFKGAVCSPTDSAAVIWSDLEEKWQERTEQQSADKVARICEQMAAAVALPSVTAA